MDLGIRSGPGGAGTSYSGGSGSGGIQSQTQNQNHSQMSGGGAANGYIGGYATMSRDGNWTCIAYGGTGNPNGYDTWGRNSTGFYNGNNSYYTNRASGTGGLLMLYADDLYNNGTISSNGINNVSNVYGNWSVGGGASGGGSVNIFANKVVNLGNMTASGGVCTGASYAGGAGGAGTVTIKELGADLIYPDKEVTLKVNEGYSIDTSKLRYLNHNEYQVGIVTVGNVKIEVLDVNIANVDETGRVIAISEGKTKVKITDETNGISTYIYLEVRNNIKVDVQEGKNYSIALKQNGTDCSYGLNSSRTIRNR